MKTMIQDRIKAIAKEAFDLLLTSYKGESDGGIIFPLYRSGKIRVSEQELRFAFIEVMRRKEPQWYYSVETPTNKKYRFKEEPIIKEDGISAQFDLTIYGDKRGKEIVAHIEFKAHAGTGAHEYQKDFLKLIKDNENPEVERFFIQIFHHFDQASENSVKRELKVCEEKYKDEYHKVRCLFFSLEAYKGSHTINIE